MAKDAREPIRSCVGCGKKQSPKLMLRVASHDGAPPVVDVAQRVIGRGAYVCFETKCVEKAIARKAFERSLKTSGLSQGAKDEIARVASSTRSVEDKEPRA